MHVQSSQPAALAGVSHQLVLRVKNQVCIVSATVPVEAIHDYQQKLNIVYHDLATAYIMEPILWAPTMEKI